MAIDKNPRQITRLRVEDQKKLEELATELTYNSTTNTVEVGKNLSVNGTILTNYNDEAFVIVNENNSSLTFSFEQGNALVIKNENGTGIYCDEFGESGELYKVATSNNLKTVFGKSIMTDPDQPGNNNIDLYRHQLKVKVGGNAVYFVITSSSNLKVASLQDLTTVTKATNGYFTLAMNPGETDTPLLVTYNNNVWGSSIGAITAITEDVVTPL